MGTETSRIASHTIRQTPGIPKVENNPRAERTAKKPGLRTSLAAGGAVSAASFVVDTVEVLAVPTPTYPRSPVPTAVVADSLFVTPCL